MGYSKNIKAVTSIFDKKNSSKKKVAALLLICGLTLGCGANSQPESSVKSPSEESLNNTVKTKPWRGDAAGYVSSSNPTSDRIELFVRLGKLLAAAHVYRARSQEFLSERNPSAEQINVAHAHVAAAFDESLITSITAIEPIIQEKMRESKQQFALQGLLFELTQDQQISDIINGDRAQRAKQTAARQKAFAMYDRIHSAVLAFFPSRHEYLLASSALIRLAGDKMATAVSANGVILDAGLVQQASALIDRSMKLDPKNASFCDSQRLPMRAHKSAIDELLNKMVPIKVGEKIAVTASDVYTLASQALEAGSRFPIKDSQKCS